jgi:6-phosphogluconolactonase/glucosamine-6-phosphate isomerase/deaminase
LSLVTTGFTGCTGALALTGGATIQALFDALAHDVVVAATAA